MANPARSPDPRDPVSPVPPMDVDPLNPNLRTTDPLATTDPMADPRAVTRPGSSSSTGILIAAVIAVLAVVGYFMFAGNHNTATTTAPADAARGKRHGNAAGHRHVRPSGQGSGRHRHDGS